MAQRKQVSWAQLRVGLLVVTSVTIFMVMVFLMTGENFFAPKTTVRVFMDNAGGLKKGDPVRLTGIDIGNVDAIIVSGEHHADRAVVAVLTVQRRYLDEVRGDSEVTLEAEGLLGQRFLDITRGSPAKAAISSGGEIKFKSRPDFGDVVSNGATVLTNLNRVINSFSRVSEQVEKGQGSLGKLVFDDSLYKNANSAVRDLQSMASFAASGQGSLGKLLLNDDIYNRASASVDKLGGIIDDVRGGKGSLGKLIYDPALYDDSRKLVANANAIVADVQAGKGTLGKILKDDAFYTKATSAFDKFDAIGTRIERGEGSMGKLMNDAALYDNVNHLSIETRQLLTDFRKNPKKFLTIQLKLF